MYVRHDRLGAGLLLEVFSEALGGAFCPLLYKPETELIQEYREKME
jgi:hypothetical protein